MFWEKKRKPQRTRLVQQYHMFEDEDFLLAQIKGASLASYPNTDQTTNKYVWHYKIAPCGISWQGFTAGGAGLPLPQIVSRGGTGATGAFLNAMSISELGNNNGYYSYGVDPANLPVGFAPIQIPIDTPVLCWAMRRLNGSSMYLIINTQAIDGSCY
jgi:hypothetical protein